MLSDEQIAAIQARVEAATPGEWLMGDTDLDYGAVLRTDGVLIANAYTERDAAFIAHARADIPALLSERAALLEIVRAVLQAQTRASSTRWSYGAEIDCPLCHLEQARESDGAVLWEFYQHAPTCPFMQARALLEETQPHDE